MTKRMTSLLLILFLIGALFLSSCKSKSEKSGKLETLKVAYRDANIDYDLIIKTAEKQGLFKDKDLKVETIKVQKNTDKFVLSGNVDVGIQPISSVVFAYLSGKPVKSLGTLYDYDPIGIVISKYPLKDIKKVKKVGSTVGPNVTYIYLHIFLQKFGINDSVKYINTGPNYSTRIAMLKKGLFDMTSVAYVDKVKALENKGYYTIKRKDVDLLQHKSIYAKEKTLETKRDSIKRFLEAMVEAMAFVKANKKESIEILQSEYELSKSDADSLYKRIVASMNYTLKLNEKDFDDYVEAVKKLNKPSEPDKDIDGMFDNSLIP